MRDLIEAGGNSLAQGHTAKMGDNHDSDLGLAPTSLLLYSHHQWQRENWRSKDSHPGTEAELPAQTVMCFRAREGAGSAPLLTGLWSGFRFARPQVQTTRFSGPFSPSLSLPSYGFEGFSDQRCSRSPGG